MTNSITPPNELVYQWHKEACKDPYYGGTFFESKTLKHIATCAAQWGADQELKACCDWFQDFYKLETWMERDLKAFCAARRPKPPSLKEQALKALKALDHCVTQVAGTHADTIRRALEALPDD